MIESAEEAVKLALRSGVKHAEAFVSRTSLITVRITLSQVAEVKLVKDEGIGLRAATGKRCGFACSNQLTPQLVKLAVSMARARPPDPSFKGFPEASKPKRVDGLYDGAVARLTPDQVSRLAGAMLQSALEFDRRVEEVSGALTVVVERCAVVNSNGVMSLDRATRVLGHLTVEAKDPGTSEGSAWLGSTSLKEFYPDELGRRAAELAVNSLNPRRVSHREYDLILEPPAVAELFYHVLGYALNGREVDERVSYFSERRGEEVASEALTLHDWGNMPHGICSRSFDDEGFPTQKTPLIDRGRLVGFVYDYYYSGKAGTSSTGNGLRVGDLPGRRYDAYPSPGLTNLVVEPGEFKREELIADTKHGLLLSRIWYTYPITPQLGDFSTTSRCGFLIRSGEVVGSAKQVRIHENLPRLLKLVSGVADDVEQVMPWGASAAVYSPTLRFSGVYISG